MKKIHSLVLFFLTLSACNVAQPSEVAQEPQSILLEEITEAKTFDVHVNDQVQLGDQTLTWVGVEDSRCPTEVECIWAGEARLMFDLNSPEGTETFYWNLYSSSEGGMEYYPQGETEVTYGAYLLGNFELKASDLKPYPENEKPIALEDYTVKLLVQPKQN